MKTILAWLKTGLIVLVGVIVLTVIVAWMSGAFRTKTAPGVVEAPRTLAPEAARLITVRQTSVPITEEAAGAVTAANRTSISPRIMATIQTLNVRAGDTVRQGDLLVTLDDRDIQARLSQAREALEAAEAQEKAAGFEFERMQELYARSVAPRQQLDQAEAAYRTALAEKSRAEKAIEETQVTLSFTEIRATTPGRIVDRLAEPGDTASPGRPILEMYDPQALQLEAAVRESLATTLEPGLKLPVRIDALDATLEGTVVEIVPQAEVGARVFRVKVGLAQDPRLYTGMFGRLIIPIGQRDLLAVPQEYIQTVGQNRFVCVVVDEEKRAISRRLITVGTLLDGGSYEVLSGLRDGEMLSPHPS